MITRRGSLQNIDLDTSRSPNAALWLDKFISEQDKGKKEVRSRFVKEVAGIPLPASYSSFFERWKKSLLDFRANGNTLLIGQAEVQGRMVVGTGNESVLETAITLHRTYGIPYIPGSALKGLAASFARTYCGADWKKGSQAYSIVFGRTDESGCITFFDALPDPMGVSKLLHTDVLTIHHSSYYQNSSPASPTDWDDPNPVPFLSANGKYLVALAASSGGEKWLNEAVKILVVALKELGIGAKTSSGYGRLELLVGGEIEEIK